MNKTTGWHPRTTKPTEPGVYETDIKWYGYWNGKFWGVSAGTPEKAKAQLKSPMQDKHWRKCP